MWRIGNPPPLLVGVQIGAAIFENNIEVPKNLKIELPYDPVIHSWVYIWKKENTNLNRYMHPNMHFSIIYNSQDIETT